MSVTQNNIVLYGSLNMPTTDNVLTGGGVTFSTRPMFTDLLAQGTVDYVSSNAGDGAGTTITTTGRDGTGVIQTEAKTLNGTTVVAGGQNYGRILQATTTGSVAVGDLAVISHTAVITNHTAQNGANTTGQTGPTLTLQSGDGASVAIGQIIRILNNSPAGVNFQLRWIVAISGDVVTVNRDWGTVPTSATTYSVFTGVMLDLSPNQVTTVIRCFDNDSADVSGGAVRTFLAKIFAVNTNTSIALTVANILKQTDPGASLYANLGQLDFALCSALNDTGTTAARQTGPTTGLQAITSTILNGGITAGALSITVNAFATFPQTIVSQGFYIQIDSEILRVTAGAGTNTWTVVRGVMGSTAAAHNSGATVNQFFTSGNAPIQLPVPSPQILPSGNNAAGAQGIWLCLTLPAGIAAGNTSFNVRGNGSTT